MGKHTLENLPEFLDTLGLDEAPMGVFYTDKEPADGFSPKPNDLPTREKEIKNEINWQDGTPLHESSLIRTSFLSPYHGECFKTCCNDMIRLF